MANNKDKTEKQETARNKTCFIITPIGGDNSDIRRKTDGLIDAIIKPVLNELGYKLDIPHEMTRPGSITDQIIDCILNADIVIANLSGLNPNVMYELAIRHAVRKPVVCVVENNTTLPFDIQQDRVIFYSDEFYSVESMKCRLSEMVKSAVEEKSKEINNPIYRAIDNNMIMEYLAKDSKGQNVELIQVLLDRFNRLENMIMFDSRRSVGEQTNYYSFRVSSEDFVKYDIVEICSLVEKKLKNVHNVMSNVRPLDQKSFRVRVLNSPISLDRLTTYIRHVLEKNYELSIISFTRSEQLIA